MENISEHSFERFEIFKNNAACQEAFNRANKILGLISRNFVFKTIDTIRNLYTTLVHPHLEYGVQFGSPHYRNYLKKLVREREYNEEQPNESPS